MSTVRKHGTGLDQVAAMSKLMGQSLAGFRVGDLVDLATVGRCEVVALKPPSLLTLRTSTGAEIVAGVRAVRKVSFPSMAEGKP